jgi:hypothetical protein
MQNIMNKNQLLPEEQEAFNILTNVGLEVNVVPTGKNNSPEFIVDGDDCGYVVEVKARRDSEEWERNLKEKGEALESRSISFGRWASDVARKALKQFKAVDPKHERWWVLWFSIECRSSIESMFQQAIGTLFGVRQILDFKTKKMWDCLYAQPGVFERHSEIIAVVVTDGDKISLCVNELAEDYDKFSHSVVHKTFERFGPPNSVSELIKSRNYFVVDPEMVDRKDDGALARYLGQKYNLETLMFIDMKEHTASVIST